MSLKSLLYGRWTLQASLTSYSNLVALLGFEGEGRNVSGLTEVAVGRQTAKEQRWGRIRERTEGLESHL